MHATNGPNSRPVTIGVLIPEEEGMPPGLDPLFDRADVRLIRTDEELLQVVPEAQVMCVWDFRRPRLKEVWSEAAALRWVHASSAGVDAVLFPELAASDVVVTNTRGVLDDAIAEFVLANLLAFVKDLPATFRLQQQRDWRHRDTERLAGRRVLVLGAGSIGRSVARYCRAAGMRAEGLGSRPRSGDEEFEQVVGPEGLHEALSRADFAVVCLPLTAETKGMVGAEELAALPEGARLVNVARGPVVDEAALLASLRSGHLAGAALDVFEQEPLPADHPFWGMEQVIVSAHQAGDFIGWEEAFSAVFVENFERFVRGEALSNVVDKVRLLPENAG